MTVALGFLPSEAAELQRAGLRRALWLLAKAAYLVLVVLFLAVPVLVVIVVSFDVADYVQFPPSGLTLRWYSEIAASSTWRTAIFNSAIVGIASTTAAVAMGVPAAYVIARREFIGRTAVFAFVLSPLTIPWVVFGLAILNFWSLTGLPRNLAAIVIAHTVMGLPYIVRTCVAVLVGIPSSFEKAARTLGASASEAFFLVTLPMMKMAIIAGAIFCLLISFINVPVPLFLTTASTPTIQVALFSQMLSNTNPTVAAISVIQLALILVALYAGQRVAKLGDFLA